MTHKQEFPAGVAWAVFALVIGCIAIVAIEGFGL